jgi:hypothetical protein
VHGCHFGGGEDKETCFGLLKKEQWNLWENIGKAL